MKIKINKIQQDKKAQTKQIETITKGKNKNKNMEFILF